MREKLVAFLSGPEADYIVSDTVRALLLAFLGAGPVNIAGYTALPPAGTIIVNVDGGTAAWAECTVEEVREAITEIAREIGEDPDEVDDTFAELGRQLYDPMPELSDYL